jgi:hypothetical protein
MMEMRQIWVKHLLELKRQELMAQKLFLSLSLDSTLVSHVSLRIDDLKTGIYFIGLAIERLER